MYILCLGAREQLRFCTHTHPFSFHFHLHLHLQLDMRTDSQTFLLYLEEVPKQL